MLLIRMIGIVSLFAAFPLNAQPAPPILAEWQGYKFKYTAELVGNDFVRISGTMLDDGRPFSLLVSPLGQVDGRFGDDDVSYWVPKGTRDRLVASLRVEPTANLR